MQREQEVFLSHHQLKTMSDALFSYHLYDDTDYSRSLWISAHPLEEGRHLPISKLKEYKHVLKRGVGYTKPTIFGCGDLLSRIEMTSGLIEINEILSPIESEEREAREGELKYYAEKAAKETEWADKFPTIPLLILTALGVSIYFLAYTINS